MVELIRAFMRRHGLRNPVSLLRERLTAEGFLAWTPLVPEAAFKACALNAIKVLQDRGHAFGDYVEFGISRGTSMACVAEALRESGVKARLVGFDSFEGLGDDAEADGWGKGDFASTESATRRYLASRGVTASDVILVKGWFCDTATAETRSRLGIEKASLLMVDSDTYQSSLEALMFGGTIFVDDMVVLFDDWGWSIKAGKRGQKEAFDEFLNAHPEVTSEALPSYREEARVFLLSKAKPPVG